MTATDAIPRPTISHAEAERLYHAVEHVHEALDAAQLARAVQP